MKDVQQFFNNISELNVNSEIDLKFINNFQLILFEEIFNFVFSNDYYDVSDLNIELLKTEKFYQNIKEMSLNVPSLNNKLLNIFSLWKKLYDDSINCDMLNWIKTLFTSEYMFKQLNFLPYIDNTVIVAGYLKSIEQLLYFMFITYYKEHQVMFDGEEIKIKNLLMKKKFMLRKAYNILENSSIFQNENLKSLLLNKFDNWILNSRNGYFHKDLIETMESVENIRKETFEIIILLLLCDGNIISTSK